MILCKGQQLDAHCALIHSDWWTVEVVWTQGKRTVEKLRGMELTDAEKRGVMKMVAEIEAKDGIQY